MRATVLRRDALSIADSFITLGLALAIVAFVAQTLMHLTDVYLLDRQLQFINADEEANIPTWASASSAFVAAVAALLLAVASGRRVLYGGLAALLGFMSLDDAVQVHERIVHRRVHSLGPIHDAARIVWPLLYLPLLILGFVLLVLAARALTTRPRVCVWLGLGLLVASVGAEFVGTLILELGATKMSLLYTLEVIVEEGAELVGWIAIAVGLLAGAIDMAERHHDSVA
ncbi:MAG: hypothetical protein M5U27_16190 [Gaiella sp.]|nr:hypothetical protein [Gaiella sp.]